MEVLLLISNYLMAEKKNHFGRCVPLSFCRPVWNYKRQDGELIRACIIIAQRTIIITNCWKAERMSMCMRVRMAATVIFIFVLKIGWKHTAFFFCHPYICMSVCNACCRRRPIYKNGDTYTCISQPHMYPQAVCMCMPGCFVRAHSVSATKRCAKARDREKEALPVGACYVHIYIHIYIFILFMLLYNAYGSVADNVRLLLLANVVSAALCICMLLLAHAFSNAKMMTRLPMSVPILYNIITQTLYRVECMYDVRTSYKRTHRIRKWPVLE